MRTVTSAAWLYNQLDLFESVTSLWILMSVLWLLSWSVLRSVCDNFLKSQLHFQYPYWLHPSTCWKCNFPMRPHVRPSVIISSFTSHAPIGTLVYISTLHKVTERERESVVRRLEAVCCWLYRESSAQNAEIIWKTGVNINTRKW